MAVFTYRAVDEKSNVLTGHFQARSEQDLEKHLGMQGLTLIEASRSKFSWKVFSLRFNDQELLDFSYLLKLIAGSGISLLTGLNDLVRGHSNKKMLFASRILQEGAESGMPFSDAMQEHPNIFPGYYVQMIRAGELSGNLEKSLQYLMDYLEWQINFKKAVKSGLSYPAIIAAVMALLLAILFIVVFPSLVKILSGLGAEIPLPTRIILSFSGIVKAYFFPLAVLVAGMIAAVRIWGDTPRGKQAIHRFILALPLIGGLVKKINLSRYFKQLYSLHSSGLNIQRTFATAAESVTNVVIAEKLMEVTDAILTGASISHAMKDSGVFDELTIDMIALGERTGNLESSLVRVTEIFDREVPETIKKVLTYVEPLTIVVMGGIVLLVLLSIFLPIYKVVGHIRVR